MSSKPIAILLAGLAGGAADILTAFVIYRPATPVVILQSVARVAEIAAERRIPVLTDEIYRHFLYEGAFTSISNLPGMADLTIILDGFSKSYAMTGWRLGFGVMPQIGRAHV